MDGVSDVAGESIVHCTHLGREGAQAVKKLLTFCCLHSMI